MIFEIENDLGSWKGTEVELGVHFLLKIHVDNCVADCMVQVVVGDEGHSSLNGSCISYMSYSNKNQGYFGFFNGIQAKTNFVKHFFANLT